MRGSDRRKRVSGVHPQTLAGLITSGHKTMTLECVRNTQRFPSLVKSMLAGLKMFVFNPMDKVIVHDVIIYEHSKYND